MLTEVRWPIIWELLNLLLLPSAQPPENIPSFPVKLKFLYQLKRYTHIPNIRFWIHIHQRRAVSVPMKARRQWVLDPCWTGQSRKEMPRLCRHWSSVSNVSDYLHSWTLYSLHTHIVYHEVWAGQPLCLAGSWWSRSCRCEPLGWGAWCREWRWPCLTVWPPSSGQTEIYCQIGVRFWGQTHPRLSLLMDGFLVI